MKKNNYSLLSFKVSNFRSFYDEQEIVFNEKVLALYGANASGKSNFSKALNIFWHLVMSSTNPNNIKLPYDPFLLKQGSNQEPTIFEVIFGNDTKKYRYSFAYDAEKIIDEKMYDISKTKPAKIFIRSEGPEIGVKKQFGKLVFSKTRDNSLLITSAREFNNEYANALLECLKFFNVIQVGDPSLREYAIKTLQQNPDIKKRVVEILKNADFSIRDFNYSESIMTPEQINQLPLDLKIKESMLLKGVKNISFTTNHGLRNQDGELIDNIVFDMGAQESIGTNIFFDIIIPIIDTIDNGRMLYIDEFGSSLHTDICEFIIKLFKDNNSGARLIVNTHDVALMKSTNQGILDRDNIIFVEKNNLERSVITPLRGKRTIRQDDNLEKKFRSGVYGGKPFIKEE